MKKFITPVALALLSVALPASALENPSATLFIDIRDKSPIGIALWVIRLLLSLAGTVSMIYIVWGGFLFMSSGVDAQAAAKGKKTLTHAITGLIIVILSYIIITVVVNSLFQL